MNVTLIDSMGSDISAVNAARVSFAKEVGHFSDKDEGLIKYLATHDHWTPFSQITYQVRIKAPIFIARQWFKHMIGITRNEVSRRYVSDTPEFWSPNEWRLAAENKKQGSSDEIYASTDVSMAYQETIRHTEDTYKMMLKKGICPEQARSILPQAMITQWIETGSLAAAARIFKLRTEEHAQVEIQQLAQYFGDEIKNIAPVCWKYLTN